MTEQATSVPMDPTTESGSESESESDLTPLSIEGRIARTDAHLQDWRTESVRRREAWDREQEQARAEAAERRRRMLVPIVSGTAAVALLVAVAVWALWPGPAEVAELPEVAPPPVDVAVEPVVHEPPVVEPVVEPPVEEEPVAVVEEPVAAPEPPPVVPVLADTVELWRDDAHHWVRFTIGTDAPAWMIWRDASGARVLEDMGCAAPGNAGHVCKAGRSHFRIGSALKAGAVPGDWTVEVCTVAGCTPVGTFAVP